MKVDLYTKVILSVIALCLIYIVGKDVPLVPEAHATSLSTSQVVDVNIVSVAGHKFAYSDVGVTQPYLPVQIFK